MNEILKGLSKRYRVYYLSYSSEGEHLSKYVKEISLPFKLLRGDRFLFLKSALFPLLIMLKLINARKIIREKLLLAFCDDGLPYYYYIVKKVIRTKTIYRMGDHMIGYLVDPHKNFVLRVLYDVLFTLQRLTLSTVDNIIVISDYMKEYLILNGVPESKLIVVPESVDTKLFESNAIEQERLKSLRKALNLQDNIVLLYHGSMVSWKNLDIIVKAMKLVTKKLPNIKLLMIGSGPLMKYIRSLIDRYNLAKDVILLGWIPYHEIPLYIALSDIGIVARKKMLANDFVLTTAFLQYISMGKPALVPKLKTLVDFYKKFSLCQYLVYRPDSPVDLSSKIIRTIHEIEEIKKHIKKAQYYVRLNYSHDVIMQLMLKVLNAIIEN